MVARTVKFLSQSLEFGVEGGKGARGAVFVRRIRRAGAP